MRRRMAATNARALARGARSFSWAALVCAGVALTAAVTPRAARAQARASESRLRKVFPRDTSAPARMKTPHMVPVDTQFTALGRKPFWALSIRSDSIIITTPKRPAGLGFAGVPMDTTHGGLSWRTQRGKQTLAVRATVKLCRQDQDSISYSHSVEVRVDGRVMRGCGGRRTGGRR